MKPNGRFQTKLYRRAGNGCENNKETKKRLCVQNDKDDPFR